MLGIELSFKTSSPDGLLLCTFSPGDQDEFLAIQIKGGRPYFLFDPQVSKVSPLQKVNNALKSVAVQENRMQPPPTLPDILTDTMQCFLKETSPDLLFLFPFSLSFR